MFVLQRHWLVTTTRVREADALVHQPLQDLLQSRTSTPLIITLDVDVYIVENIETLHVEERVCGNAFNVMEVQHCA